MDEQGFSSECANELGAAARGYRYVGAILTAMARIIRAGDSERVDILSLCESGIEIAGAYGDRAQSIADDIADEREACHD